MNKSNFANDNGFFRAEFDGIAISISDQIMSDDILSMAEKVLKSNCGGFNGVYTVSLNPFQAAVYQGCKVSRLFRLVTVKTRFLHKY